MGARTPRIPDKEIDDFMQICKSERDDSGLCRPIIGQLRWDMGQLRQENERLTNWVKHLAEHAYDCMEGASVDEFKLYSDYLGTFDMILRGEPLIKDNSSPDAPGDGST